MKHLLTTAGLLLPLVLSAQEYGEFSEGPRPGMRYALSIMGIIASFFLVKYRERMGGIIGEAEWMRKVGGVYNVIVTAAIFIFFWSIAALTGTTDFFLKPITFLIPGSRDPNAF